VTDPIHIPFYMAASTLALGGVISLCARGPNRPPLRAWTVLVTAALISVLGIVFAKYGANFGLPWWVYYTVPMLCTVLIPPLAFRLSVRRALAYVFLAFLTAPAIHVLFTELLGWTDYMPFWKVA
jgi:hypothetical protein